MTPSFPALFAAAAGISLLAALAWRDHARRRAKHRSVLDPIAGLFTHAHLTRDATGLPRLEGHYRGRHLRLDLVPDTLTIRRLPQLWLVITAIEKLPALRDAGFAALVRPSGADYYSLIEKMDEPLSVPASFPEECVVKGESPASRATLARADAAAAHVFKDPKVKEIAATLRGARLVYQLAQGERGNYLLLRQCEFGDAKLEPALLNTLCDALAEVLAALEIPPPAPPASN